jgi:phosphatidylinositol 3-kinase
LDALVAVERAAQNLEIANFLHWYIFCQQLVEADMKDSSKGRGRCYERAQRRLMKTLEKTDNGRATIAILQHQHDLVTFLTKLAHDIKKMRESRQKKVDRLKAALSSTHPIIFGSSTSSNSGIVLNMNPHITATGALVFKF